MKLVYLVVAGNKYEGLQASGAFSTIEKAKEYLNDLFADEQCYLMDKEKNQFDARIDQFFVH